MSLPDAWPDRVVAIALAMAVLAFLVFIVEAAVRLAQLRKAASAAKTVSDSVAADLAREGLAPEDVSKTFEAAAKLIEAFNKATPGVVAIVSSMIFLAIAGYIAKPPPPHNSQAITPAPAAR